MLIGGFTRKPAVLLLGASLVAISLVALALSRLSTRDLNYTRKLSSPFAFFGDNIELSVQVNNDKPLPVDALCQDEIDNVWRFLDKKLESHYLPYKAILPNEVHLGGYETVTRRYSLTCEKRGVFAFGPAAIRSQDPLGLYRETANDPKKDSIIVYPKTLPVNAEGLKDLYPFGDNPRASWLLQDPIFLKMMRPYQPQDPLKHVDWKATARTGQLQTRVFDMAFGQRIMLCLNLVTLKNPWDGVDTNLFESLVTVASSVALKLASSGFSVGLVSNGISMDRQGYHFVAECPPASGGKGLRNILSCLAGLGYYTLEKLSPSARRTAGSSSGAYKVVLAASFDRETRAVLRSAQGKPDTLLVLVHHDDGRRAPVTVPSDLEYSGPIIRASLKGGWENAQEVRLSRAI
jgi:uncharacterized protein (DUF58 family)